MKLKKKKVTFTYLELYGIDFKLSWIIDFLDDIIEGGTYTSDGSKAEKQLIRKGLIVKRGTTYAGTFLCCANKKKCKRLLNRIYNMMEEVKQ